MVPVIPTQKKYAAKTGKAFNRLIKYIEENKSQEVQNNLSTEFDNLLNYATAEQDKRTNEEKCIAIRTHRINDLSTATAQMNAVASKNTRCKDPAYHFILSWPEHEHLTLTNEAIFDAAEHAIKSLGLGEHQYVIAIHGNTDNTHCHIAVNRVHPSTYKSHHIEWAAKTLHMAARESEIKHGWTHDNGIYIVKTDGKNKKSIILNPAHDFTMPHAHREFHQEEEKIQAAWHDAESLESWLKSRVAKDLKYTLSKLESWNALHSWLSNYHISLTDTGGGGMRLYATLPSTGEVINIPTSKGLRMLKRSDLEKRWGKFTSAIKTPCITPDLSHLTQQQLTKGVKNVLRTAPDHGVPPNHILYPEIGGRKHETEGGSGLHELSTSSLDGGRQNSEMLLPDTLQNGVGNEQTGQNSDMRRAGASPTGGGRGLGRDNSKRQERKEQRAAARADLRQRFAQYRRFSRESDADYYKQHKDIRAEYSQALKAIKENEHIEKLEAKKMYGKGASKRLYATQNILLKSTQHKLQAEVIYQRKIKILNATRTSPLGWREWLFEQSNLGDQAAISALRGIVYQAQRDAKHGQAVALDEDAATIEAQERQYQKILSRLLEEEKREVAIRAAKMNAMRPYEADALLARYVGVQWSVTGNGNIEYTDQVNGHLFTDRGNRVTFDRVKVSDQEIQMALIHAQQKFGKQITLTGDDRIFSERMAKIADDMGLIVLNTELQSTIQKHRAQVQNIESNVAQSSVKIPESYEKLSEIDESETPEERLQAQVLSVNPYAKFEIPDKNDHNRIFSGQIVTILKSESGEEQGFAQHLGRGVYALHMTNVPDGYSEQIVEIKYTKELIAINQKLEQKDKGRKS